MNPEPITSIKIEIDSENSTAPYGIMRFRLTKPSALAQKFRVLSITNHRTHTISIALRSRDGWITTLNSHRWDETNQVRHGDVKHSLRIYFNASDARELAVLLA